VTVPRQFDKKIIVDIDNTLWDLAPVLWENLRVLNPHMPPSSRWTYWDICEDYVSLKDLFRALRDIHSQQDRFRPYPEAKPFLLALKEKGFRITIASHRETGTLGPTERWLHKYDLVYDEIHLSRDKSVLFDHHFAIVDDSPVTLDKAARAGIVRAGLVEPWNEGTDHPLFNNLNEILMYIDSQWTRVNRPPPAKFPLKR
jgi:hypothetical protein